LDDVCARRLAEALVEFDRVLALEVQDHLEARANEWDRTVGREVAHRHRDHVRRYRALAELIESLSRVRLQRHS
jgi:hypothetical protein